MTPERWAQIDDLFARAVAIEPRGRDAWLGQACGDDQQLRAEVRQLLEQDEAAARDSFLSLPDSASQSPEQTRTWLAGNGHVAPPGPEPIATEGNAADTSIGGFSRKPVIAASPQPRPSSESESVVRARLRELPIIHIVILAMSTIWRSTILGQDVEQLRSLDVVLVAFLGGLFALLSSRRSVSLRQLRALEIAMIGLLAARLAIVEYQLVLRLSNRNDSMMALFVVKNVVIITAILIPSYGMYVPKSWRRAVLVVIPLAVLPFATLAVLYLRHPDAVGWLGEGWSTCEAPRYLLFTFDAAILMILAVASTFGARAISLLRRQVAEARQLGQYRLRRQIGAGGMGEIYLAEHQLLKRACAVKLIRPDSVADPRALARFEREVHITSTLSHPNTVEIYDYGRTEDGTYYYVMEYLPGLSLAELVEQHGPLPPGRVVYLLRQVCEALSEAHAAGLIHRDIKPSNVIVSRRGGKDDVAKLLDFGLVLPLASRGTPQLSGEGQILGTPHFMSPEQAEGAAQLDGRSDIYSLGAVAYYLLTGRPPFDGEDGIRLLIAHARDPVVPPSSIRDQIPQGLENVVLRCLAKHPSDRFPDADSLEHALGECGCAGDWDRVRATAWWQDSEQAPAANWRPWPTRAPRDRRSARGPTVAVR